MGAFLNIMSTYILVAFWLISSINVCYASSSGGAAASSSTSPDVETRKKVCTIRIQPLRPDIKAQLNWTTPLQALRDIHEAVKQTEIVRKASSSPTDEPYRQTHGLGTLFDYVDHDAKDVQPLLSAIKEYALRYLQDRSAVARNTLIVRFTFLNAKDEKVIPVIDVGMFVSGTDSYLLRDVKQRVVKASDLNPAQSTFVSLLGGRKITSPAAQAHISAALGNFSKELKDDNVVNPHDKDSPVFSIPILKDIGRMPPTVLSSLYDETEKPKWLSQYYEETCHLLFPAPTEKPSNTSFMAVPSVYKGILMNSVSANFICKILFGKPALNEREVNGCFEDNFELSFTDSEQVFLKLLERGFDPTILRHNSAELKGGSNINEVRKIRIDFLSQKDICPFCRGFMSFLLSKDSSGRSWFTNHLGEFLKKLPVELRGDKEYNTANPLEVELYASSIDFSSKT